MVVCLVSRQRQKVIYYVPAARGEKSDSLVYVVGKVGQSIILKCDGVDGIWYMNTSSTKPNSIASNARDITDPTRHALLMSSSSYHLRIKSVTLSDAGRYACQVGDSVSVFKVSELIVLGKAI